MGQAKRQAILGYFVKYLSQANISYVSSPLSLLMMAYRIKNAYATGIDEDLDFTGDQYNVLLTMFTVDKSFPHIK